MPYNVEVTFTFDTDRFFALIEGAYGIYQYDGWGFSHLVGAGYGGDFATRTAPPYGPCSCIGYEVEKRKIKEIGSIQGWDDPNSDYVYVNTDLVYYKIKKIKFLCPDSHYEYELHASAVFRKVKWEGSRPW